MKSRDLIEKCASGKVARSIIRELEEQLPETTTIRMYLLRDLARAGFVVEAKDVKIEGTRIRIGIRQIAEADKSGLATVVDIYSKTYPEVTFYYKSLTVKA